MKRTIVTLLLVLALVGFVGLTSSLAANSPTLNPNFCAPAYTDFIGAPGSCPAVAAHGANAPSFMGSWE